MPTSTAEHSTGQSGGGAVGLCVSARAGRAAMTGRSERAVHSAEQPADPERYHRRRIGLGFDGPAKPLVKGSSSVARGVGSLAVEVLGSPRRLVELSLYLRSGVACQPSHALFDLAADVSGCARYAVFIHGSDPSCHGRRGLLRAALCQPCNVSPQAMFRRLANAFVIC
jgi:hypothetical protein